VTVRHRQGELDADVVVELGAEHRAADDQAGLGQGVALGHVVAECLIHRWSTPGGGVRAGARSVSADAEGQASSLG
jgi:hypothetical protein